MKLSVLEGVSTRKAGDYELISFDQDKLETIFNELVATNSLSDTESISSKTQFREIHKILKSQQAQSIIVERKYLDRHYLTDYAHGYSRTFFDYTRYCTRLHFFSFPLEIRHFSDLLKGKTSHTPCRFESDYLGFMVIRKLKNAPFGRTCLRPKPSDEGVFASEHTQHCHLFGRALKLKTVAFQEQDEATAACASAALWSLFTVTGDLYHHAKPAPSEITKTATKYLTGNITFPIDGLNVKQMMQAVIESGMTPISLDADIRDTKKRFKLKSYIYAFIKGGIPVILNMKCYSGPGTPEKVLTNEKYMIGAHSVAITGFNLGKTEHELHEVNILRKDIFRLKATRITTLYAHDDNVSPYAAMECKPEHYLTTLINKNNTPGSGKVIASPVTCLISMPQMIKMPIEEILNYSIQFDRFVKLFRADDNEFRKAFDSDIEWEITLIEGRTLKSDILETDTISARNTKNIFKNTVPAFVWRATGSTIDGTNSMPVVDIFADATDLGQRNAYTRIIPYGDFPIARLAFLVKGLLAFNAENRRRTDARLVAGIQQHAG